MELFQFNSIFYFMALLVPGPLIDRVHKAWYLYCVLAFQFIVIGLGDCSCHTYNILAESK